MPQYVIHNHLQKLYLGNYEGIITTYTEPQYVEEECNCPTCRGEKEG